MNYDFIEIGTSDFRTLLETSKEGEKGLCVEPLKHYLDRLPNKENVTKVPYAVSSKNEKVKIFHVTPEDIVKYNLPNWVRGCNSINHPHPSIKTLLGDKHDDIVKTTTIESVTWAYLIKKYNIESVNYLKVDTEGHDGVILLEYYKECIKNPKLMANTIFFENNILRNEKLIKEVIQKFEAIGYKGFPVGEDYKLVKINKKLNMKISFNMATIPSRYQLSLKAIESIYDQADIIRVYLNNFTEVPKELKRDKIVTHIGKDLNATGKLFWSLTPNEYYFCIDDDLRYPPTYSQDMIQYIEHLGGKVCVSLHGKTLKPTPLKSYFNGILHSFHCLNGFDTTSYVHVIGNGVSAFNTNKVKIDYTKFKYHHMDDIEVSLQLQQQKTPAIVIAHESNYLSYEEPEKIEGVETLFTQYHNNDSTQTERINSISWKIYDI